MTSISKYLTPPHNYKGQLNNHTNIGYNASHYVLSSYTSNLAWTVKEVGLNG